MVGQTLGHYRVLEKIGAGGMGVVYRAHDERLERDVALKVLPAGMLADEAARKRFRKEALALSKLNHPNIATVHDFDTHEGVDFVVMEFIQGSTLGDHLHGGPLPEKDVLRLGKQIVAALDEAHTQGIVHRDLKPGNIMVTTKGQVKVLDFGLAKMVHTSEDVAMTASVTDSHSATGTLPYMSPEQLRSDPVDARTDIWAAGAVLYEMATGQRPFPDTQGPRLIDAILNRSPRPPSEINPHVSPSLENIILKALEKDPALRYQSAREIIVDQERMTASLPVSATARRAIPQKRPRILVAGAAAVVAVALLAALSATWWRSRTPPLGKRPLILVGEFENRTSEAVFDDTLRELVATSLLQSRYVSLYPLSRVLDALRRMQRPTTARVDESTGREICEREGLQALVVGSVSRLGSSYVLVARVISPDGRELVGLRRTAPAADQVPAELDVIVQELRTGLGESLASVQETSTPLAQVTSASLDAVRYYTRGKQRLFGGEAREAISLFEKALELDASFAMAHEYLGVALTNVGEYARAETHLHDASLLANRVTEVERLKILGDYHLISGNYEEACGYLKVLADLQANDPSPRANLGTCYAYRLDFAAAVTEGEKALLVQPQNMVLRNNLARSTFLKGDTSRAIQLTQEVIRERPADFEALTILGRALLLSGKPAEARQTFEAMVQAGGDTEVPGHRGLADLARASGRYGEARSHLEAAALAAEKRGNAAAAARARIALADLSLAEGLPGRIQQTLSAIQPPADPALTFLLGRAWARARQTAQARNLLRQLENLADKKPTARAQALREMLRAELALAQGEHAAAVQAAEAAARFENSALAVETLARAYSGAGQKQEAIGEFEKVLARSNERTGVNERTGGYDAPAFHRVVETHYDLAVLYQGFGDTEKARGHLETFLGHWSEADSGLGKYADAQKRLRSLTSRAP